jgi:hypothetical protein
MAPILVKDNGSVEYAREVFHSASLQSSWDRPNIGPGPLRVSCAMLAADPTNEILLKEFRPLARWLVKKEGNGLYRFLGSFGAPEDFVKLLETLSMTDELATYAGLEDEKIQAGAKPGKVDPYQEIRALQFLAGQGDKRALERLLRHARGEVSAKWIDGHYSNQNFAQNALHDLFSPGESCTAILILLKAEAEPQTKAPSSY